MSLLERRSFMRTLLSTIMLACAVLVVGHLAAAQGIYWESTTTIEAGGGQTMQSETYAMPKMLKHVSKDGEAMIMRLDQQVMYALQPSDKTYWKMTLAEMEAMMKKAGAKVDDAMKEMESAMKDMSPEQRKMMEGMLGEKMKGVTHTGPVEVRATGKTKKLAGFTTNEYVATREGEQVMTAWTTNGLKEFASLRKDWEEFNERLMSMDIRIGKGIIEAWQKIDGFPMETEMMGVHTVVTKVEPRAISASTFEVPPGYTQVDPPSME
jgi:hypothetical protein